jgi:hypothetical protein
MMGLIQGRRPARKEKKREPAREKRIDMEIVVDAYDAVEQAMSWYYYLKENLKFPFPAMCVKKRDISPLKRGERVEVVGMPPEDVCEQEMFVAILWNERRFAAPLDQLQCESGGRKTKQAVEDWRYWVEQGYRFG